LLLRNKIIEYFLSRMIQTEILIPFGKERIVEEVRPNIQILEEKYQENGIRLTLQAASQTISMVHKRLTESK
jgi:50S ribosomal subunit-associated GTPase HflX